MGLKKEMNSECPCCGKIGLIYLKNLEMVALLNQKIINKITC